MRSALTFEASIVIFLRYLQRVSAQPETEYCDVLKFILLGDRFFEEFFINLETG
ncbi:MAG: hypothetical protein ACFFB2_19310 [Promethearchaeota archaeon]